MTSEQLLQLKNALLRGQQRQGELCRQHTSTEHQLTREHVTAEHRITRQMINDLERRVDALARRPRQAEHSPVQDRDDEVIESFEDISAIIGQGTEDAADQKNESDPSKEEHQYSLAEFILGAELALLADDKTSNSHNDNAPVGDVIDTTTRSNLSGGDEGAADEAVGDDHADQDRLGVQSRHSPTSDRSTPQSRTSLKRSFHSLDDNNQSEDKDDSQQPKRRRTQTLEPAAPPSSQNKTQSPAAALQTRSGPPSPLLTTPSLNPEPPQRDDLEVRVDFVPSGYEHDFVSPDGSGLDPAANFIPLPANIAGSLSPSVETEEATEEASAEPCQLPQTPPQHATPRSSIEREEETDEVELQPNSEILFKSEFLPERADSAPEKQPEPMTAVPESRATSPALIHFRPVFLSPERQVAPIATAQERRAGSQSPARYLPASRSGSRLSRAFRTSRSPSTRSAPVPRSPPHPAVHSHSPPNTRALRSLDPSQVVNTDYAQRERLNRSPIRRTSSSRRTRTLQEWLENYDPRFDPAHHAYDPTMRIAFTAEDYQRDSDADSREDEEYEDWGVDEDRPGIRGEEECGEEGEVEEVEGEEVELNEEGGDEEMQLDSSESDEEQDGQEEDWEERGRW
ncbi:MAG: retrotransposon-like protein 1 [Icmadophila ericetorum]|nr:retrotransposon-like protein 1 [Icmadophila ericetorum]